MDRTKMIFRVLSGIASESEKDKVQKWADASQENQSEFSNLKLMWANLQVKETEKDDSSYAGFLKIKARVQERAHKKRKIQVLCSLVLIVSIAASLIVYFSEIERKRPIVFHQAQLHDVITFLEGEYRIKIETENTSILTCPFTGSFTNVRSVDEIVQAIGLSLDLKCEIVEIKRYRLSGEGCVKL